MDGLAAGVARRALKVEPGLPGPGLRLWGEPFTGPQETPLTVGALVATSGGRTGVIIGTDLLFFPDALAERIREQAARIAGTTRELVLLNASHDHAVPPLPGGQYSGDAAAVGRFGSVVEGTIAVAVRAAAQNRRPARLGVGFGSSPISVYRRERGPDGRDHLGEVPGAPIDPAVGVLRFDDLGGSPIAVLFSFGCHPVLWGPRAFRYSSDFPGAARAVVERNLGGTALFLQACSGDVNPRYGIGAEVDPTETKDREGTVLGAEVLRVASEIRTAHRRGARTPLSGFGISLWPWLPVNEHAPAKIAGAERRLDLPLSELPSAEDAREIQAGHHRELDRLEASDAPWLDCHIQRRWADWSDVLVDAVQNARTTVPVTVQALRIGEAAFAAVAMETFSATGMEIKARSPFAHTQLIGVSNGFHGYLPRAEDLPAGGWKATERYAVPDLYAPAWLQAAAIGPAAEQMVVGNCLAMLESIA
jgi:neutral ceramidase